MAIIKENRNPYANEPFNGTFGKPNGVVAGKRFNELAPDAQTKLRLEILALTKKVGFDGSYISDLRLGTLKESWDEMRMIYGTCYGVVFEFRKNCGGCILDDATRLCRKLTAAAVEIEAILRSTVVKVDSEADNEVDSSNTESNITQNVHKEDSEPSVLTYEPKPKGKKHRYPSDSDASHNK